MTPLKLDDVRQYVEDHIHTFHEKRLERLRTMKLDTILKRKNPYLFKAKNVVTAAELVKGIVDAYLSSQEETMFGGFLEGLAIFVNQKVYGGIKPSTAYLNGVDLIFRRDNTLFVVEIKSGPNWGNSSQIKKMHDNFATARNVLGEEHPDIEIVCVNGCCYGQEHIKTDYIKLCGQDFWEFISGNPDLYTEIIEPVGYEARERNEAFYESYTQILNVFTLKFMQAYCVDGVINWAKLVEYVSKSEVKG